MCASKMENHGVRCFITVPVIMRNVFFIRRPIRPCDMHNTANVSVLIQFTDLILIQLLKTSERKMVMSNIASNLSGIFSRFGKTTE